MNTGIDRLLNDKLGNINYRNTGKLTVLVGGQFGSEGKGSVVSHIADRYDVHVRVGSFNAGHTFFWHGDKHVMQAIPCGWTNPKAAIVIGRGAIFPIKGMLEEIAHIEQYYPDFKDRLFIDAECGILEDKYHEAEGGKDGWFNTKIGSTGEGCGAARIARMQRDPDNFKRFKDVAEECGLSKCLRVDTPKMLADMQDNGLDILIEGTQGSGLSLIHSFWPYCTSIDTNASGIISEVGIAPTRVTDVLMVCRTYPIRVAGNSGPIGAEITWDELYRRMGTTFPPEKTTVTHKVRRIAEWNDDIFEKACVLNRPTEIALTFADYIDPTLANVTDPEVISNSWKLNRFIIDHHLNKLISMVGTGPSIVVDMNE